MKEELSVSTKIVKALEEHISASAKSSIASEDVERARMKVRQITLDENTPQIMWEFDTDGKITAIYKDSFLKEDEADEIRGNNDDSMHQYKIKLKEQLYYG